MRGNGDAHPDLGPLGRPEAGPRKTSEYLWDRSGVRLDAGDVHITELEPAGSKRCMRTRSLGWFVVVPFLAVLALAVTLVVVTQGGAKGEVGDDLDAIRLVAEFTPRDENEKPIAPSTLLEGALTRDGDLSGDEAAGPVQELVADGLAEGPEAAVRPGPAGASPEEGEPQAQDLASDGADEESGASYGPTPSAQPSALTAGPEGEDEPSQEPAIDEPIVGGPGEGPGATHEAGHEEEKPPSQIPEKEESSSQNFADDEDPDEESDASYRPTPSAQPSIRGAKPEEEDEPSQDLIADDPQDGPSEDPNAGNRPRPGTYEGGHEEEKLPSEDLAAAGSTAEGPGAGAELAPSAHEGRPGEDEQVIQGHIVDGPVGDPGAAEAIDVEDLYVRVGEEAIYGLAESYRRISADVEDEIFAAYPGIDGEGAAYAKEALMDLLEEASYLVASEDGRGQDGWSPDGWAGHENYGGGRGGHGGYGGY